MSQTPSARRRAGYNSFFRGGNERDFQPYSDPSQANDWLEGWAKAKHTDDIKIAEEEAAELAEMDEVEKFARLYHLAKERRLIP